MNKLIVISAPSGGGKTTLCNRLLSDFPELTLSISSTTRKPRGKEKHGVDYFFITHEKFQDAIKKNQFAEWAIVHGNHYGTPKTAIESSLKQNKAVLLDIDVQGAESLRKTYPNQCITIFIIPPDVSSLEKRLKSRGTDSEDTIQKRLQNAKKEMNAASRFDHVIVNDELERAYLELKNLIKNYLKTD